MQFPDHFPSIILPRPTMLDVYRWQESGLDCLRLLKVWIYGDVIFYSHEACFCIARRTCHYNCSHHLHEGGENIVRREMDSYFVEKSLSMSITLI